MISNLHSPFHIPTILKFSMELVLTAVLSDIIPSLSRLLFSSPKSKKSDTKFIFPPKLDWKLAKGLRQILSPVITDSISFGIKPPVINRRKYIILFPNLKYIYYKNENIKLNKFINLLLFKFYFKYINSFLKL